MTARLGWLRISTLLLGLIGPARAALAQDSVVVIHRMRSTSRPRAHCHPNWCSN